MKRKWLKWKWQTVFVKEKERSKNYCENSASLIESHRERNEDVTDVK